MNEFLQILFLAATTSFFIKAGKYFDIRVGPQYLAQLKDRRRLEKYWKAIARQSPERFAYRVLFLVEQTFIQLFSHRPIEIRGLLRFIFFSFLLNFTLAFSAMFFTVPVAQFMWAVSNGTLPAIFLLLVVINIPLDMAAYLLTRAVIRLVLNRSLSYIQVILVLGVAILVSYGFAVLSTTISGALTFFALLDDAKTVISIIPSTIAHWVPTALKSPFTSQVQLSGINVGYLAIGALPSVIFLILSLTFMIVLSTLARFVHYEFCVSTGRLLDDKKSFFEHIALLISVWLFVLWSVLWLVLKLKGSASQ